MWSWPAEMLLQKFERALIGVAKKRLKFRFLFTGTVKLDQVFDESVIFFGHRQQRSLPGIQCGCDAVARSTAPDMMLCTFSGAKNSCTGTE